MSDYESIASDATLRPEDRSANDTELHAGPHRHADRNAAERSSHADRNASRALGRAKPQPKTQNDPEQILRSFNTWAYKREQPSDPQLLLQFVAHAVAREEPIPMLFYWGKGLRCMVDEHDIKCMDFLDSLAHRVAAAYPPGAAMRLILTDTHARLNGHAEACIHNYFSEVETEARRRNYACSRLSALVEETQAKAEDYTLGDVIPADMLDKLCASALKWYFGGTSAEQGAVIYFHMNMIEKRAVEIAFPDAIFATFNSSKFRILFPRRLPIFYMYSLQRGVSVKPWFLPADAKPCDGQCSATKSGSPART